MGYKIITTEASEMLSDSKQSLIRRHGMLRRTSSFEIASSTADLFGTVNNMMQWFSCLKTAALSSGVHVLLLASEML